MKSSIRQCHARAYRHHAAIAALTGVLLNFVGFGCGSATSDTGWCDAGSKDAIAEDSGVAADLPTGLRAGDWRLVWSDEFEGPTGARPGPAWFFFDGWDDGGLWRDAHYADGENAQLDGSGHLELVARLVHGELHTAYLQTYDWAHPREEWTTFGPGNGRYIEASIRLDGMDAGGLWCAFWLFDPEGTYDGDPATGTEMDIMEYVVAYGAEGSWTAELPGGNSLRQINVANHWGDSSGRLVDAYDYEVDLRDGEFHRFGLEWHADLLVYYMDGHEVFRTRDHVSTSPDEAIMLTIEYDEPPDDVWGLNEFVSNYADRLPNRMQVDYVRVYARH